MVSHLEIEETAARWLAQRDSGGWSDADEAELSHWLNSSTAHRVAFLRLEAAWEQADRLKALGAGATPGLIPNPGEWWQSPFFEPPPTTPVETATPLDLSTPPPARIGRIWLSHSRALAASLVIVAIVGGGSYFWPHGSVYRTDVGGLASVPLSDGETGYGVLTLVRRPQDGRFTMAELGLVQALGEQMALAIRAGRP